MKLIDVHKQFSTEDKCLDYLENMRWPNGVACVHCGVMHVSKITREKGKNKRMRIYQCLEKECGKQFSATSGTIFSDTHLPLEKWFLAIALVMEAKKGISANQLKRHLGVNYRTAWYLAHRIREAMQDSFSLLNGVVETDETFIGPKKPRKGHPQPQKQKPDVVFGMIERGGRLRMIPIADAKMASIEPVVVQNVSPDAILQTDKSMVYDIMGARLFPGRHRMIDHITSYGVGENHTNSIENAFSLLKRGVYGTFHKVSIKHLGRYCNEFSYRFNRRDYQEQMFGETMKNLLTRKNLPYKKLTASQKAAF